MRLWERLIFQKSKPARTPITDSNPSNPLSHRRNFTTYLPSSIGELQCGRRGTRRGTRKSDHTEYRVPRSFLCVPERFVSHGSTPAVWPNGGTLSSAGGPCVSPSTKLRTGSSDWRPSAPMRPGGASLVLGPFAGTKGPRLPGRNPATQNITWTRELGTHVRGVHLPALVYWQPPRWIPDTHRQTVRPEP
jgi:hypothetical protein